VHPQTAGEKYTVTFLQKNSQPGRKKVQRVSISPDNSPDDLRASFLLYITGRLPEPDKTRFEEHLLVDQDFSNAAATWEQELIDAYALRRPDTEETRAIRLWIEASPDRVERVAIARALLKATPRQDLRKRQLGAALALAACLVIAATLYFVISLRREQRATQQSIATAAPPQNQTPPIGVAAKPDVVLIAAERTRGEQKTTTYQVHRESPIQLQIVLPGETARTGYQVRVTPATDPNKILLQQNDLEAQSMAGQLYLAITLPPGSLPPAIYIASVSRQGDTLTSTFTLKWVPE
jgi:hypothetical protein